MPLPIPTSPETDPTTDSGYKSTVRVTRLVFQLMYANRTTLIAAIAIVEFENAIAAPSGITSAEQSMTSFRACTICHPRATRRPENQPPNNEPTSENRY